MNISGEHIERVLSYLNTNVEYALLRNFEGLPYNNKSRDIDIIIDKREFKKHKKGIINALLNDSWKLFSYLNNGRLITYVCAKMTDGGEVELVQWDFFINTSVHGVILLGAKEMVASREFNGSLYHVSKDYEFLDKYLYNRSVGAPYPQRYLATRSQITSSDVVKQMVKKTFGCSDINIIDQMSGKSLFVKALLQNFCLNPFSAIYNVARSWFYYIKDFIVSDVAPKIAFTGADGAGKTTVIDMIQEKIASVYGKATEYLHFRPLLIPNIGEAAHSAGLKKEVDREYDKPHRGAKTGALSSFLRLCYYSVDYVLGYWFKVKPHAKITKVIIFDRYFTDVIVDSRRSSIYLNTKFLYGWGKLFIPKMKYNILLTADPDIILSRKQELDREGIERINTKMEYLAAKKGYYMVMNNGTAEEAVDKILSIVIDEQHKRNLRRV
ncbi:MAG: hypothetical protein R3Y08_00960 [Rikenellaceae bacterium]